MKSVMKSFQIISTEDYFFSVGLDLTSLDYFFLIGDFSVASILVISFTLAYRKGNISFFYYRLFWIGCLIGSTWEFTFLFLGSDFLHSVKDWPFGLDGWPRKLSHSIWDGGIFMVGVLLCNKFVDSARFLKFSWNELGIMLSWGIFQELLVEYLFNGRVWVYEPLPWNPVIIPPLLGSATTVGFTLMPQLVWVVAPIVFYLACIYMDGGIETQ